MKNLAILAVFASLIFISCKNSEKDFIPAAEIKDDLAYISYGKKISNTEHIPASDIEEIFSELEHGDTLLLSFQSTISSVCKQKGCWMSINLPGEEDVLVKFKDYGFFVPKDIEGKEVVVNGKAYITEVSVEKQRHYAEDNGKTGEEIAAITKPQRTFSFMANGVEIKR